MIFKVIEFIDNKYQIYRHKMLEARDDGMYVVNDRIGVLFFATNNVIMERIEDILTDDEIKEKYPEYFI